MWFDEGRKFYFFDQYFSGFGGAQSPERTNRRFELAFKKWQTTKGDVIYAGDDGFIDSQECLHVENQRDLSEDSFEKPRIPWCYSGRIVVDMKKMIDKWPELSNYVPENAGRFEWCTGKSGLCTHPVIATDRWVESTGGENFSVKPFSIEIYIERMASHSRMNLLKHGFHQITTTPPEGFFWGGAQRDNDGENLFLMWLRNGRRFWFHHRIVDYHSKSFIDHAGARLKQAIMLWENSKKDVIYSEKLGWYEPEKSPSDKGQLDED